MFEVFVCDRCDEHGNKMWMGLHGFVLLCPECAIELDSLSS